MEHRVTSINTNFDILSVVQLKIQVFWIVVLGLLKNSYILKDSSVSIFRASQSKKNDYVKGVGKLCVNYAKGVEEEYFTLLPVTSTSIYSLTR